MSAENINEHIYEKVCTNATLVQTRSGNWDPVSVKNKISDELLKSDSKI